MGHTASLFFFLISKEPVALTKAVPSNPFVSTETLKACALIGLHFLAEEGEAGSSGSQSNDLGDMQRQGCFKSPHWEGDVESWTEKRRHFVFGAVRTQRGKPCSECYGARPVR